MKKIFFSMIAMAMTAMTFTSCEDVPMPYDLGSITNPSENTTQLLGSGTEDDPYNVAKAMDVIKNGPSTNNVYVKGIVVGLGEFNANYGNYTYYINDTKTSENQLEVYRGSALGSGTKFKSESDLNIGDTVIVCGALVNFNGTYEFTSGNYLTYLNGKSIEKEPEVGTPEGSGTASDPYNVAATIKASKALSATDTIKAAYVSGIISKIDNIDTGSYGNATYYISDDGTETNQYEIFLGYYFNGDKFTAADQIKVGQKVVVKGDLINYKGNTIEMTKGSQIISLDGKTSGSTTPTETIGLEETFSANQGNFTIENASLAEGLEYVWKWASKNYGMKATAFVNKTNLAAKSLLISPEFSLKGLTSATLTFDQAGKYFGTFADECKVLASTDKTNWTELAMSASLDGSTWDFTTTTVDLSKFAGKSKVYIAFQYTSTSAAAPTWEIKNVSVK